MSLARYHQKRSFTKTPEPKGRVHRRQQFNYYIQKHAASHLHYDFRLELNGTLKSWAVPKGPSLKPAVKRLAIQVEDHPLEYGTFEGLIPKGEYGGGTVLLWDQGHWQPLDEDPLAAYKKGHLRFELYGKKLRGRWDLIRFKQQEKAWFLIKYQDEEAKKEQDIVVASPRSVLSGQTIEEIAENAQAIWTNQGKKKAPKVKNKISLDLPAQIMLTHISPQLATLVDEPPDQEFLIGGFSSPRKSRNYFGSLYLGVYNDKGEFVYAGKVGTGFSETSLKEVFLALKKRITKENPFLINPPGVEKATWVKPQLVAEVAFTEWTKGGHLRHPSFKGLRYDKKPPTVKKELEESTSNLLKKKSQKKTSVNIALTHADKILYPEDGITKQELYDYYHEIASLILPFIQNRPLTIVRCPDGYHNCFFQKKRPGKYRTIHPIAITSKAGETEEYFYIKDEAGLLNLIQMATLEIHPWGSTIKQLEQPDMLIFDLDPAPDVTWGVLVNAAFEIKEALNELKLTTFVKTTGGKGLHLVVPIEPRYNWEDVKIFSKTLVQFLVKNHPKKYIETMSKAKRPGKIFIDYLRNQRGATAIAPYATRARLHAPISTPLAWEELTSRRADTEYNLKTIRLRLRKLREDPWQLFWSLKQELPL